MTYRSSAWTGRAPRTMQQAFGAHVYSQISEPVRPFDWQDKLAMGVGIVVLVAVVVGVALGVLA